jgi:hypothetical protein
MLNSILKKCIIVALALFLISCIPTPTATSAIQTRQDALVAQQALTDFLNRLYDGNFEEAAELYGGTYETMLDQNPSLDPNDPIALLQNACTINGYECLKVKSVKLDRTISATEITFKVEFMNGDGTLFILGPCCGGNETDSPSQSAFIFKVIKNGDGKFQVMGMPPYIP